VIQRVLAKADSGTACPLLLHVSLQQVFGLHARRRIGLHHHALQRPALGKSFT
jgi:hypothetical protein